MYGYSFKTRPNIEPVMISWLIYNTQVIVITDDSTEYMFNPMCIYRAHDIQSAIIFVETVRGYYPTLSSPFHILRRIIHRILQCLE